MIDRIWPRWTDAVVPLCAEDCPSFDGKRCEVMGFRPDRICEPAIEEMGKALRAARDLTELGKEGLRDRLHDLAQIWRPVK